MKKINIIIAVCMAAVAGMTACRELPHTQSPTDGTPPPPVSNIKATPLPGGAKITYEIPAEQDISYVKAVYTDKGETKVIRSSIYNNFVTLEGFASVAPVTVTLYLVDHSENVSEGREITFSPETPPIDSIFESVEISPLFGGVGITWTNRTGTEIGVTVYIEDADGIMREQQTKYSNEIDAELSFRPFAPIEQHFAITIVDKWGNQSAMKEGRITPLFERELDKKLWTAMEFPGDNTSVNNNRPFRNCWDGAKDIIWHTVEGQFMPMPFYVTIDCGVEAKFSRMNFLARDTYWYINHTFREFEIWGAKNYKQGQGTEYWTGDEWKTDGTWVHVMDCEVKRPSGNPDPVRYADGIDLEFGQKGYEYNVPLEVEPFRYVRIVVNRTWSSGAMHMAEFYFYGDDGWRPDPEQED